MIKRFKQLLLDWYDDHKRSLPWRDEPKPYNVWISEIILQQTRIDQGLAYYYRFLRRFPTVAELARATDDEVFREWQGLGYYNRARNLKKGAQQVTELGRFPKNYDEWLEIKGVGPYTAAAISSIAFNEVRAVVDGNVERVLSRIHRVAQPVNQAAGKRIIQDLADRHIDAHRPGDYNQAIMELGAMVCSPKNPDCENCPVASLCESRASGTQTDFPVKVKKTKVLKRRIDFMVRTKNKQVLLRKRNGKDIWNGLYSFPEHPSGLGNGDADLNGLRLITRNSHVLSHRLLDIHFWEAPTEMTAFENDSAFQWIDFNRLEDIPFPVPMLNFVREYLLNLHS